MLSGTGAVWLMGDDRPLRARVKISLMVLGCLLVAVIIFVLRTRKSNKSREAEKNGDEAPVGKPCSVCGVASSYGYSEHAEEDADKIKPLCLTHLRPELEKGYQSFEGQAVVIEPAEGPPCYVFQPAREWGQAFKDTKIADDVSALLSKMDAKCRDCGQTASYLWVESKGLTGDNFGDTLDKGLSATLLRQNAAPISLCPKCCVKRITGALETKHLSYLEVCVPKGSTDGFVIPMGY